MASNKKDNVVDLTDGEDGAGSGKKKPAKTAKPAKKDAGKKNVKDAGGKKKGSIAGVIVVLLLIILIGGFIFEEVQFNYLGTRDWFVATVVKLDPNYKPFEERFAELDAYKVELDKREKTLDTREEALDKLDTELEQKKNELDEREIRLTPVYRLPLSGKDLEDMESLSKTYSQMDPAVAADILSRLYDRQDMAAILYYMPERNAATVLAAMDAKLAAALTEILLYK